LAKTKPLLQVWQAVKVAQKEQLAMPQTGIQKVPCKAIWYPIAQELQVDVDRHVWQFSTEQASKHILFAST
jgi:hypothetical protein